MMRTVYILRKVKYQNVFDQMNMGSKGWRSGESARLPPMWPGFNAICGLSLLLVLSFAPRGFSPGTLVFPSPQKPAFPNSNSTRNQVDAKNHFVDVLPPNHYLFILFIYLST